MAGRAVAWTKVKKAEADIAAAAVTDSHSSYELKWAGEKDAEAYKKQCKEDRRKSLAGRNFEGGRIKEETEQQRTAELQHQSASYELKWEGERVAARGGKLDVFFMLDGGISTAASSARDGRQRWHSASPAAYPLALQPLG